MKADLKGIWLARPEQAPAGIPLAVKDLFDTVGLVTTYGSILFAEHVPERTAEAVRLLEAAGYTTAGKTNLHEFAYGTTSENPHFGTVPNPVAPGRMAGGSSGGSAAALAAGQVEAGLGSDSGGSIRIPAACCGIVGFKPSFGLVPLEGCFPLAPSFDHAGPMGRSVDACGRMMAELAPGSADRPLDSLEDVEVGVAWVDRADPLVRERVLVAAAHFPRRRDVELPFPEPSVLFQREVADVHRELFLENADAYGENVRVKVERCLKVTDAEYEAGLRERERYRERMADMADGLDLLVTPTMAMVAPPLPTDELVLRERNIQFTYPFNELGWPALALPCGPAEDGLPASVQLVGKHGADGLVLAAGRLLEHAMAGEDMSGV
jgi:aspartyl-tRNA(Asn)/glutamyl-tRNA(Gln) amidotransferase subunit A